ncbi:MAG: DnaJ domain-containing protein [Deltaproteobacteria bacterium]|nr:DnaJ domain-containing protein [Deltaproteobacteria bacterium]
MTELARGSVGDRPWGLTLGALGMRGLTGQLVLSADGKRYQIAFSDGVVVGATSPLASDAAVRIAMTGGLLSSTQVADIARRQQANPQRDEVDLIAELIRLAPEQAMKLRRRAIAQRAARTFSIERGEFSVDDRISLPIIPGAELDIRSVIFLGARSNLSEARLSSELAELGSWFQMKPEALLDLPQYGFARTEDPVLDLLERGATVSDLEIMGSEPRVVRAMIYALMSCSALDSNNQPTHPPARPTPPTQTQRQPLQPMPQALPPQTPQTHQARPQPLTQAWPSPAVQSHAQPRQQPTHTHQPPPPQAFDPPTTRRTNDQFDGATVRRPNGLDAPTARQSQAIGPRSARITNLDPNQANDVRALIKKHLELLKGRADHFKLLGSHIDATPDELRKAYFALARQLHPDRLTALGIADDTKEAQRLFAQVNTAFGVVSDPQRRQDYASVLRRGGEAAIAAEQERAEELAGRILDAEEAFRRGEAALRRDQLSTALSEFAHALELNSDEVDYHAAYAWAEFCSSPDKMAIASKTRITLERAINKSPRSVAPRFYAGRVERMLGRDADALRHFQEVLRIEPQHREAGSEARLIEQRLAGGKKR